MKTTNNYIEILKKIPLFETLNLSSLKKIQKLLRIRNFKKGKTIIREGEIGNSLFIILDGEVKVVKGRGKESVASLGIFDFFGEMSILENKPRSASVIAKKETVLLQLNRTDFEKLVSTHTRMSFEIMKTLSSRIRETDTKLIEDLKAKNKELKKTYNNLKNMQEELIKAERLSTIGKVTRGIIHDLKNPLSIIKGYIEYIKNSEEVTTSIKKVASTMISEINIVFNMIQKILEFSKGKYELEKMPVDIDKFMKETANTFQVKLQKRKIKLKYRLKACSKCEIDPQKMRRVFLNIISNANDAMENGGQLTISTSIKNKRIHIEFKDTGIGIDKKELKNIFEPFYTKGKKKGVGLGIAIAKKFVEEHKGSINVRSKKGSGTVVTVQIPIV